jgi:hypothetical protein
MHSPEYLRKFLPKKFGDIGAFDMGTEIKFMFKNRKRVGVRNDVIILNCIFDFGNDSSD